MQLEIGSVENWTININRNNDISQLCVPIIPAHPRLNVDMLLPEYNSLGTKLSAPISPTLSLLSRLAIPHLYVPINT